MLNKVKSLIHVIHFKSLCILLLADLSAFLNVYILLHLTSQHLCSIICIYNGLRSHNHWEILGIKNKVILILLLLPETITENMFRIFKTYQCVPSIGHIAWLLNKSMRGECHFVSMHLNNT